VIAPGTGHSLQEGPENGQDLPDLAVAQSIFGAIASTGNDAVQPGDTGTSLDQTQTDPVAACSTHTTVTATPTNPDHAGPAGASVGQTQTSLIPAQPPQSPMLTTGNNPIQARQTGTSLFRIFPSGSPRRPNIRLLLVSANPKDWPQLDVAREISVIKAVLDNSSTGDTFEIQNLEDCGPQQFIDAVDSFDPHIIQFAGHGTRHSLVFVNERQRGVKGQQGKISSIGHEGPPEVVAGPRPQRMFQRERCPKIREYRCRGRCHAEVCRRRRCHSFLLDILRSFKGRIIVRKGFQPSRSRSEGVGSE
jgi:hypothetical protein